MATTLVNLPGVRIQEVQLAGPPIIGVGTSTAGFVGVAPLKGQFTMIARLVTSSDQFTNDYINDPGGDPTKNATKSTDLSLAVLGFFQNGGAECYVVNTDSAAPADVVKGLQVLEKQGDVEIIAAPGSTDKTVYDELEAQAQRQADRFAILDSPPKVDDLGKLLEGGANRPQDSIWAAFYYPRIQVGPVLKDDPTDTVNKPIWVAPSGHIAGVYARVDGAKGVHKAPANEVVLGAIGAGTRADGFRSKCAQRRWRGRNPPVLVRADGIWRTHASGARCRGQNILVRERSPLDHLYRAVAQGGAALGGF